MTLSSFDIPLNPLWPVRRWQRNPYSRFHSQTRRFQDYILHTRQLTFSLAFAPTPLISNLNMSGVNAGPLVLVLSGLLHSLQLS
jgi:hypothetical protein